MRVMYQVLPPGVQNTNKAQFGAQVLGVGGYGRERLGARLKEERVADPLVLVGHGRDRSRQREDHVKIFTLEQLCLAVLQPLGTGQRLAFGTMPVAAGVVADALLVACVAALHVAAERRCAALLDRAHHARACDTKPTGVHTPVGGTMLAEDVRHLEGGPHG